MIYPHEREDQANAKGIIDAILKIVRILAIQAVIRIESFRS